MLTPLSWLQKYVDITVPPENLAHLLTMVGLEVESIDRFGENFNSDQIVVGEILEINQHPNADRLLLPKVRLSSSETVDVVCGATNLSPGIKIVFAKPGATLFNQKSGKFQKLKASVIRGISSPGMICSELELGIGLGHENILILDKNLEPGSSLQGIFSDTILDLSITPNRPDCLSIIGVAREVAAITNKKLSDPEISYKENSAVSKSSPVEIHIESLDLCKRYCGAVVENVTVGPSPTWLKSALAKMGHRSINNIVDVTNYVMYETGQPLHAFDLNKIQDSKIEVRPAKNKETLLTLDNDSIELNPSMLVIADSKNPVALAGIIGGLNSSVTQNTTRILLESANFNPTSIRKTASGLKLRTDASYRFERNPNEALASKALKRAIHLIQKISNQNVSCGKIIDAPGAQLDSMSLQIDGSEIEKLLGVKISQEEALSVLHKLGFQSNPKSQSGFSNDWTAKISIPDWRSDIKIQEDLIEEIARILGYDQFPTSNISSSIPEYIPNIPLHLREQVRDACVEFGMQEVITYSLKNESLLSSVSSEDSQNFVNIANPLNSEAKTLRTNLMVGILETLSSNQNFLKEGPVKIFEIGRTFINKPGSLPIQNEVAVGLISGNSSSEGWTNTKNRKLDFYDIKGILEGVLSKLKLEVKYIPSEDSLLVQGQSADILIEETKIGKVGKISGHILSSFEINETNTLLFELDLNTIYSRFQNKITFKPFATFPTSERDLTVLADADIPSEKIESIILASKLATKCIPIDIYEQGSGNQKKSITYKIVFQSTSKTLTANEVSNEIKTILLNLKKTLDVDFRDK